MPCRCRAGRSCRAAHLSRGWPPRDPARARPTHPASSAPRGICRIPEICPTAGLGPFEGVGAVSIDLRKGQHVERIFKAKALVDVAGVDQLVIDLLPIVPLL